MQRSRRRNLRKAAMGCHVEESATEQIIAMARRICQGLARGKRRYCPARGPRPKQRWHGGKGSQPVSNGDFNWIVSCIRCIADDVLRRYLARGKYRGVLLSMTILRHPDVVLADGGQAEKAG